MTLLIGKGAPNFTTLAVMPDGRMNEEFNLGDYIDDHYAVVFFYALNYSYVCPAELVALNRRMPDFVKRRAKVVAVSVDSHLSHERYRATPIAAGGVGPLAFPLITDMTHSIAKAYDVLLNESVAARASFVIDTEGYVRFQHIQDLPFGRNIDDLLNAVDALEHHKQTGYVTEPHWRAGAPGIKPTADGVAAFMAARAGNL